MSSGAHYSTSGLDLDAKSGEHLPVANRDDIISTISHRLRTPLTVVTSAVNNLLDGVFGKLTPDQEKWLQKVQQHNAELEKLLNEILGLMKSEVECNPVIGRRLAGETAPESAPAHLEAGAGVATILIVDDEPDVVDVIQEGLSTKGYRTLSASNGDEAFDIAMSARPDLILMDVHLDHQDGVELCGRIKKSIDAFTPVILVTGQDALRQKMAQPDQEADDLLMKPFQIQELYARVGSMLRLKKLMDELSGYRKAA